MNFIYKNFKVILCLIPVLSFALHEHIFNLDLVGIHVWRQTETQTVINNFYRDSMNIFDAKVNNFVWPNRDFRLEFPILEWLIACCYKVFGTHIAVSRVFTFIMGLCSVYGMYYLCMQAFANRVIATICAWCFNFSPLFYYYTVNPLPDNMALCCGIWSVALFYRYSNTAQLAYLFGSAVFMGLSVLIKLPFVLYGSVMLTWFVLQLRRKQASLTQLFLFAGIYLLFLVPAIWWYLTVIPRYWGGMLVLKGVARTDITLQNLLEWLWGNTVSVLPELLVNYGAVLFFLLGFYYIVKQKTYQHKYFPLFATWGLAIIAYFLFELNVICLVHDYYMEPFLPVIFLVVAYGAYHLLRSATSWAPKLALFCLAILPLTAFLRINSRWNTREPNFNVAYYNSKDQIRALIPPNALVIAGNDLSEQITLYYIDRKGWTFYEDLLDDKKITDYMSKGATYLFSDTRVDEHPDVQAHLSEKIFENGTLRVYKLK